MKMRIPRGPKINGLLYEVDTEDKDFDANFGVEDDNDQMKMMIEAR